VIKSRRIRWARGRRSSYKVLVGFPEGKRPYGRAWHKWKKSVKMNLEETE
jgi:hypothetical protein